MVQKGSWDNVSHNQGQAEASSEDETDSGQVEALVRF
jgi:hypothetical protein